MIPTNIAALAAMIAAEPSPPPQPDLYRRLSAQEGSIRAGELWRQACSYLDSEARASALSNLRSLLKAENPHFTEAAYEAHGVMQLSHHQLAQDWQNIMDTIRSAASRRH